MGKLISKNFSINRQKTGKKWGKFVSKKLISYVETSKNLEGKSPKEGGFVGKIEDIQRS